MDGTMLWFNVEKGYGYIQTDDDERLYVAQDGFMPDQAPQARCKGQRVSFMRDDADGDARAINVFFLSQDEPRRARLRRGRGGHAL